MKTVRSFVLLSNKNSQGLLQRTEDTWYLIKDKIQFRAESHLLVWMLNIFKGKKKGPQPLGQIHAHPLPPHSCGSLQQVPFLQQI